MHKLHGANFGEAFAAFYSNKGTIFNYAVHDAIDRSQEKKQGWLYIYAVEKSVSIETPYTLRCMQIHIDDAYSEPHVSTEKVDLGTQCGDILKVSEGLIVLSCLGTNTVSVYNRKTHKLLYEEASLFED